MTKLFRSKLFLFFQAFQKFSQLILIEQTLFALPFAYIGILFAGKAGLRIWLWVTIALISARTAGMSFNRIIDKNIDRKNPRTKGRLLPAGKIKPASVWMIGIISSLIFIFSSYMLNSLCFILSFAAVIFLISYSFFKRFSSTSHFYLGLVEAAAPVGGYLAVTGKFSLLSLLPGIAIMMWISGVDIVYALQDLEFDKKEGLHSVPVSFGLKKALLLSVLCYVLSLTALAAAGILAGMGPGYWSGTVCIAVIFFIQQAIAVTGAFKGNIINTVKRFFFINKFISPILFASIFIDVYLIR